MLRILHITAHLGGGAGKAIAETAIYGKINGFYDSTIISLEFTQKSKYTELCKQHSIKIIDGTTPKRIDEEIKKAEIVQVSWWHHPLMAKLLAGFPAIPARLVLWNHISGCNYPAVPFSFLEMFHSIFFTSEYSFNNPYFTKAQREYLTRCGSLVYGSGDFSRIAPREKRDGKNKPFRVLYLGTLNYSKMSPEFARLCSLVSVPDIRFSLAGDPDNQGCIMEDAKRYHVLDKMEFKGFVTDPYEELDKADVFGYPLNSYHFGTTENALLEAMVMEIPVVAFRQCAEQYVIKHMETGLLADSAEDYARCIEYLYHNPGERKRLGKNARKYVQKEFSMEKKNSRIIQAYETVLSMPKKIFGFQPVFGSDPHQWFLSCLGNDYDLFYKATEEMKENKMHCSLEIRNQIQNCRGILREKSKSSILQYAAYFPEDLYLQQLKRMIGVF